MALRVYSAGAIVIHTVSSVVELTVTAAEDTNNYSDAISLGFTALLTLSAGDDTNNYSDAVASQIFGAISLDLSDSVDNFSDALGTFTPTLHFTENINNWADALAAVGLDHVLVLSDGIPALTDKLTILLSRALEVSDTNAANLADAVVTSLFGVPVANLSEDISGAQADAVGLQLDAQLKLGDFWNAGLADFIRINLGINKSIGEDSDNYNDSIVVALQAQLTLTVAEDIDNLADAVTIRNNARGNAANRGEIVDYIRRYLNDLRD